MSLRIAGRFSSSQNNSLLLVDTRSNFAAIFNVDATGNLIKLREYSNWGTWTHATIVRVPGSDFSAVLRYNQATGRVEITSQNHGFAVDATSLPDGVKVTHVSLFDGSNEGLACPAKRAFSVQYHPEASPGPTDSHYLFRRFAELIEARV